MYSYEGLHEVHALELRPTPSQEGALGDAVMPVVISHDRILGKDQEQNAAAVLNQPLHSATHLGAASWWSSLPAQGRRAERCQLRVALGFITAVTGYHRFSSGAEITQILFSSHLPFLAITFECTTVNLKAFHYPINVSIISLC